MSRSMARISSRSRRLKPGVDYVWMPRAKDARGKVRGALPRTPARGKPPETPAPFPFSTIFQNGPRRPGCAPENLFKPGKDFPPPLRALDRSGPFRRFAQTRERGPLQSHHRLQLRRCAASRWSAPIFQSERRPGGGRFATLLQAHSSMRIC